MENGFSYYLVAAFITLLGGIYNVIEQDFIGASIFLVSSVVLFAIGILKNRSVSKSNSSA
jgi:hypothetical protein